jgi:hypothetical protein
LALVCWFQTSAVAGADPPVEKPSPEAPPPAATAQPASRNDAPKPAQDPQSIRLYLMDGSVITGRLSVADVEVETDFGKLTIPVARIRSFRPGLASHPQLGRQVGELVDELGSDQFERREAAQKALVKFGPSVRAEVEKRQEDADNERRTRIKAILAEFDDQAEADGDDAATSPCATRP